MCEARAIGELKDRWREVLRCGQDWEIRYAFVVPNLPLELGDLASSSSSSSTSAVKEGEAKNNEVDASTEALLTRYYEDNTFYIWGDLEFENEAHEKARHGYKMLQIVPQAMIGRCLSSSSSSPEYLPAFSSFRTNYVAQAQQFWVGLLQRAPRRGKERERERDTTHSLTCLPLRSLRRDCMILKGRELCAETRLEWNRGEFFCNFLPFLSW